MAGEVDEGWGKVLYRLNRGIFTIFLHHACVCAQMWVAPTRDMHLVNHDPVGFLMMAIAPKI
jgi:hypothetical protein